MYAYSDQNSADTDEAVTTTQPKHLEKGGPSKIDPPVKGSKSSIINDKEDPDYIPEADENYVAKQLVYNALEYQGVKYRTGGTTRKGMDCSGLVYTVFNLYDISLPRSSYQMATTGEKVDLKDVRKGDLLFFDNNPRRKRINHVGLVVEVTPEGEIKFIHASVHEGVIVSSMSESYYSNTFVKATRVIQDN